MAIISNSATSTAGTILEVLELPSNTINAMSDINLVNVGTVDAVVTVYISDVSTPMAEHAIEWEITLQPSQPLARTCGPMTATEKMFVMANTDDVSIRATAIVETL